MGSGSDKGKQQNGQQNGQQIGNTTKSGNSEQQAITPPSGGDAVTPDVSKEAGEKVSFTGPDMDSSTAATAPDTSEKIVDASGENEEKDPSIDSGVITSDMFPAKELTDTEKKSVSTVTDFVAHAKLIKSQIQSDAMVNEFVQSVIGIYTPGDSDDEDAIFSELVKYFNSGKGHVSYTIETRMIIDCMVKALDGIAIDEYAGHVPELFLKKMKLI
jgi:hypothetical protein